MRLLNSLMRRLGRGHPDRASLADWERHHDATVAAEVQRILTHLPERGARFVDVGANIGLFSEHILRARPDAEAWLFEPVGDLFEHCSKRFAGRERVHVERFALGHRAESATIWKARHNPGGNSLVRDLMFDRREVWTAAPFAPISSTA